MTDPAVWIPRAASALSIVLMAAALIPMLVRFVRLLCGREPAARMSRRGAGVRALLLAALAMLLSRLLLYLVAWGADCLLRGQGSSLASSFGRLWVHWDANPPRG